jgi:hypothetical protein
MKIGSFYVYGISKEEEDILVAREKFCKEYCEKKGWPSDAEELSFDQILEIRSQEEWERLRDT